MNFTDRPLSHRLGRALYWFDADLKLRKLAIDAMEKLGDDAKEEDLPQELQDLLANAAKVAPKMERT